MKESPRMPTCPVCKSESPQVSWKYKNYAIFDCLRCDLQFVDPMQGAPLEYYQSHYGETITSTLADNVHPGFRYTLRVIQRAVQQYLTPERRKAIDVGCGPGYLLSELSRWGFDCLGIDFNPEVIRVAVEHYHVQAKVARVEDLVALNSRFDLALLLHVLEHAEDPRSLLQEIRRILEPNGILIIDLPNSKRLAINRSLRKGELPWFEYPPHHLTFWSIASLTNALRLTGYSVLDCHARPLGEEGQVALFLANQIKFPEGKPTKLVEKSLRAAARLARLQGETIFAIARRSE